MRAVNLIPADQRESGISLTGRSGGVALMLVGLVLGLAVLAFMYGSAKHSESKSKAELATVNAEVTNVRAQVGRLSSYTSFIAMAKQRVQDVEGLVASRFDWSHAFHELGRVLPRDASLTTLQGKVGSGSGAGSSSAPASSSAAGTAGAAATPTSATPPGSTPTFTLSGCATSQSEVALTLQRLRLIDGVMDVELQSSTKASSSSSSSSGAASGGAASGGCGSGATFSATVTFTGLPSAPPTNPPAGGAGAGAAAGSGTGAAAGGGTGAAGGSGSNGAQQVSSGSGGAR